MLPCDIYFQTKRYICISMLNLSGKIGKTLLFLMVLGLVSVGGVFGAVPVINPGDINVSGASGTGGAYIVGDTIVVEWDSAGNSPDITSVDIDFSDFGGGAAVAAADDGVAPDSAAGDLIWTASYTITSGAIDTT